MADNLEKLRSMFDFFFNCKADPKPGEHETVFDGPLGKAKAEAAVNFEKAKAEAAVNLDSNQAGARTVEPTAPTAEKLVGDETSRAQVQEQRTSRIEERALEIIVISALNSEHVCSVRLTSFDTVASLRRAVAKASSQVCPFDLIHGDNILLDSSILSDAGLQDGVVLQLMRRSLKAIDITVFGYSEGCLGCLAFVYHPSGAELRLRGARCGSDGYCAKMSCELYCEPAWLEDDENGILAYYNKTVGKFSADESQTVHVKAKRLMRMRSDLAVAQEANDGMWVCLRQDKAAPSKSDRNIFSGMSLEILDPSDEHWLKVRTSSHGEGWVRRQDVAGLGELSLEWAGQEVVLEENIADQQATSLRDGWCNAFHPEPERSWRGH